MFASTPAPAANRPRASEAAALIWKQAAPATGHEYLTRKGIKPHGCTELDGSRLRATMGGLQCKFPDVRFWR